MTFKLSLLILISVFTMPFAFGQKVGHVNSSLLVENHPSVVKANVDLEAFRKSVSDPFEVKTKAFQAKYQFYMEEMNAGTLSQVTARTRQEELQRQQDELNKEGQQIQFSIMQKRELLLKPILTEVDSVIRVVAKEGKYTMVFDNSVTGAVLFALPTEDLTEAVKARIK